MNIIRRYWPAAEDIKCHFPQRDRRSRHPVASWAGRRPASVAVHLLSPSRYRYHQQYLSASKNANGYRCHNNTGVSFPVDKLTAGYERQDSVETWRSVLQGDPLRFTRIGSLDWFSSGRFPARSSGSATSVGRRRRGRGSRAELRRGGVRKQRRLRCTTLGGLTSAS